MRRGLSVKATSSPHGTMSRYTNSRCRCEACRDAMAEYMRGWHSSKDGLPDGDPRHGTLNGYDHYRCRCGRCCAARRTYDADRRKALGLSTGDKP